jgi:predicted flavoprotein YhiN
MSQPTTVLNPSQMNVSVGTTAMMAAVGANPTRRGLVIANNGAVTDVVNVTFGPGTISAPNTPSATSGVPIAGGATFSLLPWSAANVGMGAQLNMISSTAATPVTVLEF